MLSWLFVSDNMISFSLPLKEKHLFRMRFVVQVTTHNLDNPFQPFMIAAPWHRML